MPAIYYSLVVIIFSVLLGYWWEKRISYELYDIESFIFCIISFAFCFGVVYLRIRYGAFIDNEYVAGYGFDLIVFAPIYIIFGAISLFGAIWHIIYYISLAVKKIRHN
jgi:hypothetical protein